MILVLIIMLFIVVDDILDIHKYLMKKNNMIKKCLGLFKKCFLQDQQFYQV